MVNIFGNTAKKRERNGSLDVLVTVDRRRNRLDNTLTNAVIASEAAYLSFIVFCESESSEQVLFFVDMVCLYDCREDGETVFGIERGVEIIAVDARNFLSRFQLRIK